MDILKKQAQGTPDAQTNSKIVEKIIETSGKAGKQPDSKLEISDNEEEQLQILKENGLLGDSDVENRKSDSELKNEMKSGSDECDKVLANEVKADGEEECPTDATNNQVSKIKTREGKTQSPHTTWIR